MIYALYSRSRELYYFVNLYSGFEHSRGTPGKRFAEKTTKESVKVCASTGDTSVCTRVAPRSGAGGLETKEQVSGLARGRGGEASDARCYSRSYVHKTESQTESALKES